MRVYGSPKIAKMGIHIHGELVTICVYKSPEIRALGDLYTWDLNTNTVYGSPEMFLEKCIQTTQIGRIVYK